LLEIHFPRNLFIASELNSGILARMNQGRSKGLVVAGLGLFTLVLHFSFAMQAADSLDWRKDKDSVDADISSWSLLKTLESISEATGWQVYVEPGTQRTISTKFKDRSRDRALDLLLGNLGRALLPGTNGGPPRFLVFRNAQRDATRLVRGRGKVKPIPNELIVRMKKGKSVDDLATKLGAKVLGKSDARNSGRLQFKDEEAADKAREALLDNEDVSSVDPNFPVAAQPLPDGTGGGPGNLNLQPRKEGDPLVIALIDTAVQKQGNAYDSFLLPGISVAGEATLPTDQPTHGTSMFDTLLQGVDASQNGSTTPVMVLPVDVYGNNGQATTYEVAEGVLQALKSGAIIVNLSLGSPGDTPYLRQVIQAGVEAGAVFIASAGNNGSADAMYPAAYPEVISVTAGDSPVSIASYANTSPTVDVMAPGMSRIQFNGQNYIVQGTSPAAAYISGAVAVGVANGQSPAAAAAGARRAFPIPPITRTP
jgi:hypothetical protein